MRHLTDYDVRVASKSFLQCFKLNPGQVIFKKRWSTFLEWTLPSYAISTFLEVASRYSHTTSFTLKCCFGEECWIRVNPICGFTHLTQAHCSELKNRAELKTLTRLLWKLCEWQNDRHQAEISGNVQIQLWRTEVSGQIQQELCLGYISYSTSVYWLSQISILTCRPEWVPGGGLFYGWYLRALWNLPNPKPGSFC